MAGEGGSGEGWGTAGDGSRALLPWTARPGAQRTLIPSTSWRGTPRAEALQLVVCLIQAAADEAKDGCRFWPKSPGSE